MTVNNLTWLNYFGRKFLGTIRGVVLPVVVASNALSAPFYGYLLDSVLAAQQVWMLSAALFFIAGILLFLAPPPVLRKEL